MMLGLVAFVAVSAARAVAEEATIPAEEQVILPRCLVLTDDLDGSDGSEADGGDAGQSLLRQGRYEELRDVAFADFGAVRSLAFRSNAALSYVLEGDHVRADLALARLAAFCDSRREVLTTTAVGFLAPCIAVFKNWHWTLAARPRPAGEELSDKIRGLSSERLTAVVRGSEAAAGPGLALSVYDVGASGAVCERFAPAVACADDRFDGEAPAGDGAAKLEGRATAGAPATLERPLHRRSRPPTSDLYLDMLRRGLTNYLHSDFEAAEWGDFLVANGVDDGDCGEGSAERPVRAACELPFGISWRAMGVSGLSAGVDGEEAERARRRYHSTLSAGDLLHLEVLVLELFDAGVEGDLMEAGVFRGGACVFLRGLLAAEAPREARRRVLVADSFRGIPPPRQDFDAGGVACRADDEPTADWTDRYVSGVDAVRYNFRRYGLLDDRVDFVEGFFNESLPPRFGSTSRTAPVPTPKDAPILALLRIDADAYDGVLDALEGAYHRLSPGGAVVIDDWHLGGARAASHAFRTRFNITAPILPVPEDHFTTCSADLTGMSACGADGNAPRPGGPFRRIFVQTPAWNVDRHRFLSKSRLEFTEHRSRRSW